MQSNASKTRKPRTLVSTAAIIKALGVKFGNVTRAAEALDVAPTVIYDRAKRDPAVQAAIDDGRAKLVDVAESAIARLIDDGNPAAIIFTLKTQGRKRGWAENMDASVRVILEDATE